MFKKHKYSFYETTVYSDTREMINASIDKYRNMVKYRELEDDRNTFIDLTFIQAKKAIEALGTKLISMGLKGSHIAILGENCTAWALSYLAVIGGVGVAVPLDKELSDEELIFQLNKVDCEAIITTKTRYGTVSRILSRCPDIKTVVVAHSPEPIEGVYSFDELVDEGKALIKNGDRDYLDAIIDRDELCEIIFTSGTTGANKGVMLCQRNIMQALHGATALIKTKGMNISVLPVSHSFECTCQVIATWHFGCTLCFCDNLRHVSECLNAYRPDMSLMVPLMLETMEKQIQIEAKKSGLDKYVRLGLFWSGVLRFFGIDRRRKMFKPILIKFGGNLDHIVCGGAPISVATLEFFNNIGINLINGYGISECAPLLAANCTDWQVYGSVGKPIPGTEVKIVNKDSSGIGEIIAKGDNVMLGYYKDPESTKATFTEDGWFKTGDLGRFDRKGMLYVTGRSKNLIILANGKNVSPEEIEDKIIATLPCVKEVVVYSDGDKAAKGASTDGHICAAVFLDDEYIKKNGIADPEEFVNIEMKKVNSKLASYKRVTYVAVRDKEFIKTTSQKIKRYQI